MSTTTTPPPAKRPPPPSLPSNTAAPQKQQSKTFSTQGGRSLTAQKVVVYGTGGVGKSELCANINQCGVKPLFIDLEEGTGFIEVDRVTPTPTNWDDLRAAVQAKWDGYGAIVIDSLTKAQELAEEWTLQNVPHEKGHFVKSIEGYGFGKGLTHVYETFLQLLGDLDLQARCGVQVIGIAHDCTASVPNPAGEDWARYEPRLQAPSSGKSSIRHRVKEWCDHQIYIGFDTSVNKDGKAIGSGTRTIYPTELPWVWAKSRLLSDPIPYERDSAQLWKLLLGKE
jgi:hypothetical protein